MKFFTYILISEVDNSFYIGQTSDLQARLNRHNKGGNRSTSAKRPWRILFYKEFSTRSEAFKIEQKLKRLKKREAILKWIENEKRGVAQPGSDFAKI